MSLPLLRSLRSQTLVVLVLVLGVSHLIGVSIYSSDHRTALLADNALDVAERTVGVVRLLDRIPDHRHEDVVFGVNSRTFRVSLSQAPAPSGDSGGESVDDEDFEEVRRYLQENLPGLGPGEILIRTRGPQAQDSMIDNVGVDRLVHISLGLGAGEWLNATGLIPAAEALWPRPAGVYLVSVLLGMLVVSMWMIYRLTSPLTTFAMAADRLGKDLRSKPIPETGPEEIAKAAKAFNEMQSRLQRLIDNRTEMLAAISHDLRTPITLLALRAELMEPGPERDKLLATLDEIQYMVGSVLDFSRDTFQEEPNRVVDLAALLESLCDDMADTGAQVQLSAPEQVLYGCRRIAIKRAVGNLVSNAVRYGGGAEVVLTEEAGHVVIEVQDNGPGFATQEFEQLFVPFFRAESSRSPETGGVGLGLGIARSIVESHGGMLRVGNRPEGGATAVIKLPK